ncbi:hypothetical protein [Collimonas fungivorans]|uniref:hypothetical protein n=1 Tax=Collimonas fungivorans TaxID=158899 RepID=UPI0011D1ECCE|nr:hypothetical protein [Collimonas fungivorans]
MKNTLFKKESHYGWTACAIIVFYVLFMSYVFPKAWADTPFALSFINTMASIVPALSNLIGHSPPYNNFWGVFYAGFWGISPIFFILGFFSAFFLTEKKYKNMVMASQVSFLGMCVVFLFVFVFVWVFPFLGGFLSPFISQVSDAIPFRLIAWGMTAGALYLPGLILGTGCRRFNLNKKTRGI